MKHKSRWVMLGCGLAFVAAMAGVWVSMASPSPHTRLPVDTVGTGDIEKVVLVTGIRSRRYRLTSVRRSTDSCGNCMFARESA